MQTLVLASSSKYRQNLLKKLNLDFSVCASAVDEGPLVGESPAKLVTRLSLAKARAVAEQYPDHLIIGSDQVAVCRERMLGKPGDEETAVEQLVAQSGRIVTFFTGICVFNSADGRSVSDLDICKVHFRQLSEQQIRRYVSVDQPLDCAGSFKSEGFGITLFDKIVGEDPNALIGLPIIKLVNLLGQFGLLLP